MQKLTNYPNCHHYSNQDGVKKAVFEITDLICCSNFQHFEEFKRWPRRASALASALTLENGHDADAWYGVQV